ncbi:MAG: hypothetical protein ACM4AI_23130 [Acidobacteriota bacterium]
MLLLAVVLFPSRLTANHSWGKYHWARSSNPLTLDIGDNVSSIWGGHLDTAVGDWNLSSVLDLTVVRGGSDPSTCPPTSGRIEVCSAAYGSTGWLGVAQIWVTSGSHIVQATTKVNDTYFSQAFYNTSAWRQLVMCQEVGHGFGLDHQDVNFNNANLGTCMDYTNDPDGPPSNEHPNFHDYEQLESIYAHLDGGGGTGGGGRGRGRAGAPNVPPPFQPIFDPIQVDTPRQWGRLIRGNARGSLFDLDLGNGDHIFTFVIWA